MTITNYTDLELRLQAELAELKAQLDQVLKQNTWLDKKLAKFSGLPMKYKRMEFNAQLQRENDELRAKLASLAVKQGEKNDFLQGICVALQVVKLNCPVTWKEIVKTAGVNDLIDYATFIEPDERDLAGFKMHAKQAFGRTEPRKRLADKIRSGT